MKAVVIGGSAGAIEALKTILPNLPAKAEFPIIITLHLLPRSQSLLPSIFKDRCPWPVKEAESTEPLAARTVYFAPNDYHLSIEADHSLALSNEPPIMFSRPSIDLFFKSAAAVYKSELVALLLSGANSDGAEGLRDILRRGGRAFVQAPDTADFPEMPLAGLEVSPDVTAMNSSEFVEFLHGRI